MRSEYQIYEDDVIEVALLSATADSAERNLFDFAIRYLKPQDYRNMKGETVKVTNSMGGETDWFVVPHTFGVAIAKKMIEQKAAGLQGFNESGFERMMNWLIGLEELDDAMCY